MFLSKLSSGIYHIYYVQSNGKKTKVSAKTKIKSEALKFMVSLQRQLEENEKKSNLIEIKLKRFIFEYLKTAETALTDKTMECYKCTLKSFLNFTGDVDLLEINVQKVQRYLHNKVVKSSVYQARKDRICLSSAFNWAVKNSYLESNPCEDIPQFRIPEKQPFYYSYTDYDNLLNVIDNQDIKDIVVFAVNTGLRQMELLKLQWAQIDFENKYVILDNRLHLTKGKRVRTIPLNSKALEVLKSRYVNTTSKNVFLFQDHVMTQDFISRQFKKYVISAKLNNKLNFHSLRHTFATWLVKKGAPIYEVSKLLGHANIKTTEIYSHINPEDLRGSIDLLN